MADEKINIPEDKTNIHEDVVQNHQVSQMRMTDQSRVRPFEYLISDDVVTESQCEFTLIVLVGITQPTAALSAAVTRWCVT